MLTSPYCSPHLFHHADDHHFCGRWPDTHKWMWCYTIAALSRSHGLVPTANSNASLLMTLWDSPSSAAPSDCQCQHKGALWSHGAGRPLSDFVFMVVWMMNLEWFTNIISFLYPQNFEIDAILNYFGFFLGFWPHYVIKHTMKPLCRKH